MCESGTRGKYHTWNGQPPANFTTYRGHEDSANMKFVKKDYRKQKTLPLEDLEPNTYYSFSINPEMWKDTIIEQERENKRLLKVFRQNGEYVLFPELSPQGKLHYHGLVMFDGYVNIMNVYLGLRRLKCALEIDVVNDSDKWIEYITKQMDYKESFEENGLDYPLKSRHDLDMPFDIKDN